MLSTNCYNHGYEEQRQALFFRPFDYSQEEQ